MGRHGGKGEQDSPSRRRRGPEPTPQPVPRDEPIGRRLRPEESAVTQTRPGFLGSGWSSESEPSETTRPQEERKPGGRARAAVLAVAAVAVVLGGTVFGVQTLTGSESAADCPAAGCVAEASNQPEPQIDVDELVDEPLPDDEPGGPEEPEEPLPEETDGTTEPADTAGRTTPDPAPTSTRRRGGTAPTPRPTPTREDTRAPRTDDDPPPAEEPSPTNSPSQTLVGGHRGEEPSQVPLPAESVPAPAPAPAPGQTSAPPAAGAPITVGADLVQAKQQVYTVKLVVAVEETFTDLALSVPVSGEVTSVRGAGWSQDGGLLTIESPQGLKAGEELVVSFTARGAAEVPSTCRSVQGECSVA
ncbi:hypothetical protein FHS43_005151 [Streptosporangium becharense]|uniref:CBM2 domain-containing protein n=1 Tax=Streptosporangium becharense TaxID=1816182 RepID=A0A7W9IIS8_9ACTN|nr:hypothetical protein [Streptosporangium becharense]MBB2913842.1 hypothetical protein [Streptosporangium becharense]MBB5821497.1 hypothetical protein [Streptosporangium becharense]